MTIGQFYIIEGALYQLCQSDYNFEYCGDMVCLIHTKSGNRYLNAKPVKNAHNITKKEFNSLIKSKEYGTLNVSAKSIKGGQLKKHILSLI